MSEDRTARIAAAYAQLTGRGEKVTTEALRREAGVSMAAAHEWWKAHRAAASRELPEVPDVAAPVAEAVAMLWGAAWERAVEDAERVVAAHLDQAQAEEAKLAERFDTANKAEAEAVARAEAAEAAAEQMRGELDRMRCELDAARREVEASRSAATEADRARVRAEAATDTLREVLDQLRADQSKG